MDAQFALVTPARDEADNIARTIASVRAQTVLPVRWAIVDDGSGDGTGEIAERVAAGADWITVVRRPRGLPVDFASKVHAVRAGVAAIGDVAYDFLGNLDADISVEPGYFAAVLQALQERPRLGIAGGHVVQHYDGRSVPQQISPDSVAGGVQMFRREAWDQIGGLQPLRLGGEDAAAEIRARSLGWETATLFDLPVRHEGQVLGRNVNPVKAWLVRGQVNHSLGYDPWFHAVASLYRALRQPPYGLSGAAMLAGYLGAAARRSPLALEAQVVEALRREQRQKLVALVRGRLGRGNEQ